MPLSPHRCARASPTSLPDEKSGGFLQDVPLLPKDFVLPTQPLQLRRDLALRCRGVDGAPIPAPSDPADQRRQPNPKITGDLALRPPENLVEGAATRTEFRRVRLADHDAA